MTNQEYKLKKMALAVKGLFGMAAIICAFAFLVQSTQPAHADSPEMTHSTGKYQMNFSSCLSSNGVMNWYILVWNTETGYSRLYYGDSKINKILAGRINLPTSPL